MWLVLGYGNELRGDDGVGPRVVQTVASWGLPDVESHTFHQLTPEVTALLARAEAVLFVDAAVGISSGKIEVRELAAALSSRPLAHICDPASLLGLTEVLHGRHPRAVLLSIPGTDFDFGERLSPQAQVGVHLALEQIRRWIADQGRPRDHAAPS